VIDDPAWNRVQIWALLKDVFDRASELVREAERLRAAAEAPAAPPRPGRASPQAGGVPATYLKRRLALRESLTVADAALTAYIGSRQKHQCLIALMSFVDERERLALGPQAAAWGLAAMQTELLGIDDGGDRVFEELGDLLTRPDTHGLVLEVYLVCLRSGFVGRCRDRRYELDQAIARLRERVRDAHPIRPTTDPAAEAIATESHARRERVSFIGFPVRYYVAAAGLVLAVYLALCAVSRRDVMHSQLAEHCRGDAAP
jgi:type IV/VI secretion system ImpK/VasF family protein